MPIIVSSLWARKIEGGVRKSTYDHPYNAIFCLAFSIQSDSRSNEPSENSNSSALFAHENRPSSISLTVTVVFLPDSFCIFNRVIVSAFQRLLVIIYSSSNVVDYKQLSADVNAHHLFFLDIPKSSYRNGNTTPPIRGASILRAVTGSSVPSFPSRHYHAIAEYPPCEVIGATRCGWYLLGATYTYKGGGGLLAWLFPALSLAVLRRGG